MHPAFSSAEVFVSGKLRRFGPPLLFISPSLILIGVFIYGLMGQNIWMSMTDNHSAAQANDREPISFVGLENYIGLFATEAFRHSMANLLLFTAAFLIGAMVMGFLWAWLLERPLPGGASSRPSTCSRWRSPSSPPAWCGAGC